VVLQAQPELLAVWLMPTSNTSGCLRPLVMLLLGGAGAAGGGTSHLCLPCTHLLRVPPPAPAPPSLCHTDPVTHSLPFGMQDSPQHPPSGPSCVLDYLKHAFQAVHAPWGGPQLCPWLSNLDWGTCVYPLHLSCCLPCHPISPLSEEMG
jgi:hypothetical protein